MKIDINYINWMENDPKFQCKNCEKTFKTLQGFNRHKRADNCSLIVIEFKCNKCDKIFPIQRELTRHLNRKTSCEKIVGDPMGLLTRLQCPFCLREYKTNKTLSCHIIICPVRIGELTDLKKKVAYLEKMCLPHAHNI
ncbi:MAG: hypothetical protein KAS12_01325 [Candidatus Aenigmarchaeota archaeon]|nr:hypothetical protein [Candidatus Aenigmarchaeota archaeon]